MMEEQDSKRIRSNNNNTNSVVVVVDRISALPNFILGVILSSLRTKQAVATSVLSKRWKSAWLDVHNLDLCCHDFVKSLDSDDSDDDIVAPPDSPEIIAFIRFVNRALILFDGRTLNKFRLFCHTWISSHVICWIDAAILRNVCEIHLYLRYRGDVFKSPISGFNCDSLRSLQLSNISFVLDMTEVCLPRLETLELNAVRLTSEVAFEKLINGCPMLHDLTLQILSSSNKELQVNDNDDDGDDVEDVDDDGDDGDNDDNGDDDDNDDDGDADNVEEDFMYILSSPSLRHLYMYSEDRCTLKLMAPSLENLRLLGRISEILVEKRLSSLVAVDFGVELNEQDTSHNIIVEAVRAFEHAKFLTLSVSAVRALGLATTRLSTEFKRLVKLVANTYCCSVQDIIENSEILETLIIDKDYSFPDSRRSTIEPYDHSRWTAPVVVPRCLSKSLKKVRFNDYKGLEDEREMIRYMLGHGTVLEVMQIQCSDKEDGERLALLQEISEFPRKSPVCKVQFEGCPYKSKFRLLY